MIELAGFSLIISLYHASFEQFVFPAIIGYCSLCEKTNRVYWRYCTYYICLTFGTLLELPPIPLYRFPHCENIMVS